MKTMNNKKKEKTAKYLYLKEKSLLLRKKSRTLVANINYVERDPY